MKHLYIIGNGFDIHTGLATRYADFQLWLENNYPFIYENLQEVYDINAEWWNDFEVQFGKLDINKFLSKFTPPPAKSIDEIIAKAKRNREFEGKYNIPPSLHLDSYCAKRLGGLLDVLQYCFEKWVDNCQRSITDPKYIHIEKEDSFFINFNYTDVIEMLYEIPEERLLHIHGRSSKHEHLIYGHNAFLLGSSMSDDKEQISFESSKYHKNPYEHIYKHQELQEILKDVEYVHIYGFSLSPVDEYYVDCFFNNVPATSQWEVSWFSNEDKNRIDKFILDHWSLKDRLKIIKLEEITQTENLSI